jgi:rifampicin phosphotransferase
MATRQAHRRPHLVFLSEDAATDTTLTGAKAGNLAVAGRAGLPVLPGAVLTTEWADVRSRGAPDHDGETGHATNFPSAVDDLHLAWRSISDDGRRPVVVRSSSTGEDGEASSMAGVFTSVLDVHGWAAVVAAITEVLASGHDAELVDAPMAVLIQPQLEPRWGGVLFGADPVSGRTDRLLVAAVEGGPDRLVSGLEDGWTAVLTPRGRTAEVRGAGDGTPPPPPVLRRLAALARSAATTFGGPQDIEWAVDHDGTLWLLQSRPITTATGTASGPVLGTGPVAETFPDPLAPLEADLWLEPLREGLRHALRLTGSASTRALRRSPVVTAVDGWAAADLELLGAIDPSELPFARRAVRRLDPRPPARRLRAAWRVGRLARALPGLARDVIAQVDSDLAAVPPLAEMDDRELLAVLDTGRTALRALHGYEALAGLLVPSATSGVTGASLALEVLTAAHAAGIELEQVVEDDPVVLALTPPRVGPPDLAALAPLAASVGRAPMPSPAGTDHEPDEAALVREALRVRARWVQELTARAGWELAERLADRGVVSQPGSVRVLGIDELAAAVRHRIVPFDIAERTDPAGKRARPLPTRFRLTDDGRPVTAVPGAAAGSGEAIGAGGGTGQGPVHVGAEPPAGAVLGTRTVPLPPPPPRRPPVPSWW